MKKFAKLLILPLLAFALLIVAAQTKNVKAADEDMIVVYAQVPGDWSNPCLWAWNDDGKNAFDKWPGGQMTADPNNSGWYYAYVPSWVSNVIVNANEGKVQTAEMKCNSKNSWVVVTAADNATLSNDQATKGDIPAYVAPAKEDTTTAETTAAKPAADQKTVKVHAQVPEDWVMPCIWAWSAPDGTNAFANWPGQELTKNGDWYEYDVPDFINSIIINGNAGSVQTTDLSVEAKEMWIVVKAADNATVTYEEPKSGDAAPAETTVAPTTTAAEDTDDDSDVNVGLIVGIVIAAVVVVGVVAVVVVNKKKNQ